MKRVNRFLRPKSIAVIGASNNPEKVGGILIKKLQNFEGKIIPININTAPILGKRVYPSIKNYPKRVDLVIIVTPAKTIPKILRECKGKTKNVIIISAGFSETGNKKLEKEISGTAIKNKLNLLGPNCFGVANTYLNLDTTFANTSAKKGSTAFISQSGALWSYISDLNIGFSNFVSLGNMVDLSFIDFIKYFNKDRKTKRIILYIEKLKQGKEFIKICKKSKKEIVVVKAGKTKKGEKAALSHTGSLATEFRVYQGAFKQARVKQFHSLAEALKLKKEKFKIPKGETSIITNAGGAGALISDLIESQNPESVKEVIDILGTAQAKDYEKELKKTKYKRCKNVVVVLTPQSMSQPELTAQIITKSPLRKKIIACFLGERSIKKATQILKKNKIKVFNNCV